MKRFLHSKDGNMTFLALILFTVIVFVALGVFTWSVLYTNYHGAQLAMERSVNSAVEEYISSYEVKDVIGRIDPEAMTDMIKNNLIENGLNAEKDGYALLKDGHVAYSIKDVSISGTSETVAISGTFEMNMPWGMARGIVWRTPISASSRLMFISKAQ